MREESAIKDYIRFGVLGLENVELEDEDKKELEKLTKQLKRLESISNKDLYVLQTYSQDTQVKIFSELKIRQNGHVKFTNDIGLPCIINSVKLKYNDIALNCSFLWRPRYVTKTDFSMWLSTFIADYKNKKITKIKPQKFEQVYLVTVKDRINELKAQINAIKSKYDTLYKQKENELKKANYQELNKTPRLEKEASAERYQLSNSEALEVAKTFKGVERTKSYWNQVSKDEIVSLMGWIAKHIYSIRVYGLTGGQSGAALKNDYGEFGEIKFRNPEYNDDGKLTSQDSIVAHISFDEVEDAPLDIFKKVVSAANKRESIFYQHRLNDKNLALFLLDEYNKFGFKAGESKLNTKLDIKALADSFGDKSDLFMQEYIGI